MTENNVLNDLSVIIPFTGDDVYWKDLLQDLKPLPSEAEILMVGPDEPDAEILKKASEGVIAKIKYVFSPRGRGTQLNEGARAATRNFFWFLHADSKVPRPSIYLLENELATKPDQLHYFDLQFLNDGPKLVGINSLAANLRSRYLGIPFGDQGFALSRLLFYRVGGFAENAGNCEDHMFVWAARRKRVPLNRVPAAIFTSARAYQTEGWGLLTSKRVLSTATQATGEYLKLVKERMLE